MSSSDTQFKLNNQVRAVHNGEAAVSRISAGKELTGPAKVAEQAVYAELANDGRASIVTRNAVRLQAACDLFWAALVDAGERGDLQAIDRYVARFGWLAGASLRAWEMVKREQQDADDPSIIDAIASAKGSDGHTSTD